MFRFGGQREERREEERGEEDEREERGGRREEREEGGESGKERCEAVMQLCIFLGGVTAFGFVGPIRLLGTNPKP